MATATVKLNNVTSLVSHAYTLTVNNIDVSVSNVFRFAPEFDAFARNRVMQELVMLVEKHEKVFEMSDEEIREILKTEAEINRWARKGAYKSNHGFGEWFENQMRYSLRWNGDDADIIRKLLVCILFHIHSSGFYNDITISWEEAKWSKKEDIFINRLTGVFAVA